MDNAIANEKAEEGPNRGGRLFQVALLLVGAIFSGAIGLGVGILAGWLDFGGPRLFYSVSVSETFSTPTRTVTIGSVRFVNRGSREISDFSGTVLLRDAIADEVRLAAPGGVTLSQEEGGRRYTVDSSFLNGGETVTVQLLLSDVSSPEIFAVEGRGKGVVAEPLPADEPSNYWALLAAALGSVTASAGFVFSAVAFRRVVRQFIGPRRQKDVLLRLLVDHGLADHALLLASTPPEEVTYSATLSGWTLRALDEGDQETQEKLGRLIDELLEKHNVASTSREHLILHRGHLARGPSGTSNRRPPVSAT